MIRIGLLTLIIVAAAGCGSPNSSREVASGAGGVAGKLSVPMAHDDGQWLMAAKDYANTRYSSLDQINTANAGDLRVAWTFSTGAIHGHEAAPLVVGETMYFVTPLGERQLSRSFSADPRHADLLAEFEKMRAELIPDFDPDVMDVQKSAAE